MPPDSGPSIRIDLKKLLLVLGIGVPILIVDHIYSIESGREAYHAAVADYLETLAVTAAGAAEALVEDSIAQAQALAARPDVIALAKSSYAEHRGRDEGELAVPDKVWQTPEAEPIVDRIVSHPVALILREEIGRDPSIVQVVLADRAGPTAAASLKPTLYYQGDRSWFTIAVGDGRNGAVHVGQPHHDTPTDRTVFEVGVPVVDPDEARVVGALLVTVDTQSFVGLLTRALAGSSGRASVVTSEGRMIAASPVSASREADSPEFAAIRPEADAGSRWAQVDGDRERLIAYARTSLGARFRDADWYLLISQDGLEVNEPIRRITTRELVSAAVAILLVIVLAVYFAAHRRIDVDPLHDIEQAE